MHGAVRTAEIEQRRAVLRSTHCCSDGQGSNALGVAMVAASTAEAANLLKSDGAAGSHNPRPAITDAHCDVFRVSGNVSNVERTCMEAGPRLWVVALVAIRPGRPSRLSAGARR